MEGEMRSDDEMRLEGEGISDTLPPEEESQSHRPPKRKETCKRSKVWDHFIAYTDGEEKPRPESCKKYPENIVTVVGSNQTITSFCQSMDVKESCSHMKFDQEALRQGLTRMIIMDELSFKGDDVGLLIEKCLLDLGVDKVFAITMDNASSNDTTVAYLRRRFVNWGTAILDEKYLQMRCVAHIINLIVKDGLKKLNDSIERVRPIVRCVRQSPARTRKFNGYVVEEKIKSKKSLCLDVPTRWNSVYMMLETALIFQSVFERYEIYDVDFRNDFMPGGPYGRIGLPLKDDWVMVEKFVKVLRYFYDLAN
ncbi:UNVERIFIED_CONTAM: hypothetical protein Slati_0011100 [Sesamum latifolium]|uniref:Transposase n=1 Tax=Sesamum latifolium TaxID=2727402 RepID=A0AAW2Y6B3_9LAMI